MIDIDGKIQCAQTALDGFICCEDCFYGRDLGYNDYGCRSEKRRADKKKMVNKADYSCEYAKAKFV